MLSAPPFNQIRTFLVCAEEGIFSKAAGKLNLSQAAVSTQIANLEAYLQCPLFVRNARGVKLTRQGEEMFFKLQDTMQDLETAIRDFSGRDRGSALKVSVAPTFASLWLIKHLLDFQVKHPDIDVQVISSSQVVDLYAEDVQCAIRHSAKSNWPRLRSRKIFDCLNYPMCSPQLLEKLGTPEKPEDLLSFPLMHAETMPDEWHKWFEAQGITTKKKLNGSYFQITSQGWEAAEAGLAVVMGDARLLIDKLKDGSLVILFWRPVPIQYAIYFVYPENFEFGALKTFENWLLKTTKGEFDEIRQSIEDKEFRA